MDTIINGLKGVNDDLKESDIDHSYSGCLICLLVIAGDRIYSANIGEARAVVYKNENMNINNSQSIVEVNNLIAKPGYHRLTIDQNVRMKQEKDRLESNDARIVESEGNPRIYE